VTEATNDEVEPDVLVTVTGTTGRLTLNRPQAINALTHHMVTVMTSPLLSHRATPGAGQSSRPRTFVCRPFFTMVTYRTVVAFLVLHSGIHLLEHLIGALRAALNEAEIDGAAEGQP